MWPRLQSFKYKNTKYRMDFETGRGPPGEELK